MPSRERDRSPQRLEPSSLDLAHLAQFVGYAVSEAVGAEVASAGFVGLRFSHGFLFQHLIDSDRTVGELAIRMEVTQQAVSKSVAELEELGYLERRRDVDDARVQHVGLAARGRAAVAASRKARASLMARLSRRIGRRRFEAARRALADVFHLLGDPNRIRQRRVVAPR